MNHSRLWVAAALIAVFVVGGFALSVPHTRDVMQKQAVSAAATTTPSVALRDVFKKGVHTITGSVMAPDACATATVESSFAGGDSNAGSILIAISMPADTGVCLQVPTPVTFSTTISADAGLPITATVNGVLATTTAS